MSNSVGRSFKNTHQTLEEMVVRILYIQPWNTSAYADAKKLRGSLEGLMVPRVMFEVAHRLVSAGAQIELLDCNLVAFSSPENPEQAVGEEIAKRLSGGKYKAVFLTWPTVAQGNIVRHVAQSVRRVSSVPVVIGGGAMMLIRRKVSGQVPGDIFYAGDGVEIPQLLSAIDSGNRDVAGICSEEGILGSTKREMLDGYSAEALYTVNGTFDFVGYLQKYRELDLEPMGLLEMTRGCSYGCTYCAIRRELVGVRYREPHTVAEEAEFLLRHSVVNNYVTDPTFGLHKKRTVALLELFTAVKARYSDFGWWGITRCDHVTRSVASRLKPAGCHTMSIGVETMVQSVLDAVQKRTELSASENAVAILAEAGINARLLLMHFPYSLDVATVMFLSEQHRKGHPFLLQASMFRPLYSAKVDGKGEGMDFRRWDVEVDARHIGVDTDTSVLGWLVTNLAFPSTSVRCTEGDAGLQVRLAGPGFKIWLLAAQADPKSLGLPQRVALGFLRVGYTAVETEEKLRLALGLSEPDAREVVAKLVAALEVGLVKKRVKPAEWLGIVASIQPGRWYYYPQPTEPFPQLGFSIKVGEYLEDLDQLILNEVQLQEKGGESNGNERPEEAGGKSATSASCARETGRTDGNPGA
ncbi:radical SAM protein [Candidatus Kaiserbacteria bacterium]|nr:radical SAM protein [Candidatus Kaiserbacteria bacterium]